MTLVLLHALPLDGSIWPDELLTLAPDSVAPTLYHLGTSIEEWAAGVVDLCGDEPLVLVGNSIGGSCALEVARLVPDRVRLLVLIGAKAGHRPQPEFRDEALTMLEQQGIDAAWSRLWEPLFAPGAGAELVRGAAAVAHRQGLDAIMNGVRVFHERPDRSALARSLDVPVVVVSGEHDVTQRNAADFARDLKHSEFHRVERSGHYVPLENPARVTAIVRAAIARPPAYP